MFRSKKNGSFVLQPSGRNVVPEIKLVGNIGVGRAENAF